MAKVRENTISDKKGATMPELPPATSILELLTLNKWRKETESLVVTGLEEMFEAYSNR